MAYRNHFCLLNLIGAESHAVNEENRLACSTFLSIEKKIKFQVAKLISGFKSLFETVLNIFDGLFL